MHDDGRISKSTSEGASLIVPELPAPDLLIKVREARQEAAQASSEWIWLTDLVWHSEQDINLKAGPGSGSDRTPGLCVLLKVLVKAG
eukprot:534090-Hanusia_phi.AAC.1